ncbi:translation initiation factor IF-2 [Streptomyces sp. NPDC050516]|uniref:translation initiation factor IF-2 n=1 Tax=Streptomyces sp. NPDC050516 TaxID=3365621 RepID=UPI0037BB86A7
MGGKGNAGGSTPFEGMSHEAMLAWLDQANSGTVQGAADRLAAAAKEIRKIADDLKVRPQWVEWKGAGADAFRTWSADLANATLRLGDFSEGSSTWLGHASDAIASAQVAIPRDQAGAQGNLDAAQKAHNDPDAAAISKKSAGELAALAADKEKVRQEAVAQMRKLGQAYQQSATQMNGLERPKFPPPPQAIAPENYDSKSTGRGRPNSSDAAGDASSTGRAAPQHPAQTQASAYGSPGPTPHSSNPSPGHPTLGDTQQPAKLDIDSVATLPQTAPTPSPAGSMPSPPPTNSGDSSVVRMPPSTLGGGLSAPPGPTGPGRSTVGEGPLLQPGQNASGRSPIRMPDSSPGITGGRPTPAPVGRLGGGIPKGTVVGAGEAAGHGAAGPVTGASPVGQVAGRPGAAFGQPGTASGRPGTVSGRRFPSASGGVSGGSAQQPGRRGATSSASAGAGAERGGISGGRPVGATPGGARGGKAPRDSPKARPRREGAAGYLVEDEETWQQGAGRAVPPVID